jgi:CARDB/Secretion system C-terminal sorting domain/SprB repeat
MKNWFTNLIIFLPLCGLIAQTVEQTRTHTYNKNGELTRSAHSNGTIETYTIDPVHNITQWERTSVLPDLSLANGRVPTGMVTAGELMTISFDEKNMGQQASGGHSYRIQYAVNEVFNAQSPVLATEAVAGLGIGATQPITKAVLLPATVANGAYYLFISTDVDNQIAESDEKNNVLRLPIVVRNCAALKASFVKTNDNCLNGKGRLEVNGISGMSPYTYAWRHDPNLPSTTNVLTDVRGGRYFVTVTDKNGCQFAEDTDLPSGIPMELTHSVEHATCLQRGVISVTASGGRSPYTYIWSHGATTAMVQDLAAGNYSVTVQDVNLCESVKTDIQIADACIPTGTVTFQGVELTVTPNPTEVDFTIQILGADLANLEMVNSAGQMVGRTSFKLLSGEKTILPFSKYASGVYHLKFELADGRKIIKKVVKN